MEEKLKEIVSRIFCIPQNEVNDKLRKGEGEWDSFNHLVLINELEKNFEIKFSVSQIEKIKDIKELSQILTSHILTKE